MGAALTAGASLRHPLHWHQINWRQAHRNVRRLQTRIVKAQKAGMKRKVRALQRILTRSFSGRAIAVRRVTSNRGKHTPGVDSVIWNTPEKKRLALEQLREQHRSPLPLRRVTIAKSNGGRRNLGIPSMRDRAMQALHLLALSPIAETEGDPNSYGFRVCRSAADAIGQCYCLLSHCDSVEWILEGDIRGCFDSISHEWLMAHIPMDKAVLRQWLKAGFVEAEAWYPTEKGTPQGGIISPVLANLTLDGLERELAEHFSRPTTLKRRNLVHLIRYADDFIITGRTKELLEEEVISVVIKFLGERGLELSPEKTRITHIGEGFDFLGHNIRKYDGKFLTRPSNKSVKAVLKKVREEIKAHPQTGAGELIRILNPIIKGWASYHRHGASKQRFGKVDWQINKALWRWARRRHRGKPVEWVKRKYFRPTETRREVFSGTIKNGAGKEQSIKLYRASETVITRHIKIKGAANPYDPEWEIYFEEREGRKIVEDAQRRKRWLNLWREQEGKCVVCDQSFEEEEEWHIHHIQRRVDGGGDEMTNLVLLHANCHRQVHHHGWQVSKPRPVKGA